MRYNWQQPGWPDFQYTLSTETREILLAFAQETGYVTGLMQVLPGNMQVETAVNVMVAEALKTSEIEGEYLSRPDVMSSIKNHLGLNKVPDVVADKMANGVGELMVSVRNTFANVLTSETLFEWHRMLLGSTGGISIGAWRSHPEPMQVVSGPIGRQKIHFEAPPSHSVAAEMGRFIQWFNDTAAGGKLEIKTAPLRSAIAHLYFESIHPFEDGNGRIGRAIAEKALAQTISRPVMLSLSQAIDANKKAYYNALETAQQSNEITEWINYFVRVCYNAQLAVKNIIAHTLQKAKFIDHYKQQLNDRQQKAMLRMLESPDGFEGGMTTRKYVSLTKTSKATATRDLQELVDTGTLIVKGGGRSTHYFIKFLE